MSKKFTKIFSGLHFPQQLAPSDSAGGDMLFDGALKFHDGSGWKNVGLVSEAVEFTLSWPGNSYRFISTTVVMGTDPTLIPATGNMSGATFTTPDAPLAPGSTLSLQVALSRGNSTFYSANWTLAIASVGINTFPSTIIGLAAESVAHTALPVITVSTMPGQPRTFTFNADDLNLAPNTQYAFLLVKRNGGAAAAGCYLHGVNSNLYAFSRFARRIGGTWSEQQADAYQQIIFQSMAKPLNLVFSGIQMQGDQAAGQQVGTLSGAGVSTWEIVAGDDAEKFSLDGATVRVASGQMLIAGASYQFTVRGRNAFGYTEILCQKTVEPWNIVLNSVSGLTTSVPAGTIVASTSGGPSGPIDWSLTGDDAGLFSIDSNGVVRNIFEIRVALAANKVPRPLLFNAVATINALPYDVAGSVMVNWVSLGQVNLDWYGNDGHLVLMNSLQGVTAEEANVYLQAGRTFVFRVYPAFTFTGWLEISGGTCDTGFAIEHGNTIFADSDPNGSGHQVLTTAELGGFQAAYTWYLV